MGGMRSKSNATIWMRASLFKPQLGLNSHYRERRTRFEQKQEKMHKAYITMLIKNIYILFRKIFFFKPKEDFPVHKKGLFCSREIMCWERVAAFPTMETSLLERVVQRRELGGHFHPVWLRCLIYLPRKLPLSQSAMSCKKAGCRERGLGSGIGRDSIRSRAITLAAPSLHPCLHFNLAASYTINDKRFFAQPCGDSI